MSANDLRAFLARLLGWANERGVDLALASIDLAVSRRTHLVLCGLGDLVPLAHALHRRIDDQGRPFIVCDPRRKNVNASARSPANHTSGVAGFTAAAGGSLCIRQARLPSDFRALVPHLQGARDVNYILCAEDDEMNPLLVAPAPICVPPLATRLDDLPRIVDEYVHDAAVALNVGEAAVSANDRAWIIQHEGSSLHDIEKAALRLAAIRTSSSLSRAAMRLEIAPVSLARWIGRRQLPSSRAT